MKKNLKEITDREDIILLVDKFYLKVRANEVLGPIFNKAITDWSAHLNHITDFWESSLLMARSYHGNPVEAHQKVDRENNSSIDMTHFGIWIQLWKETIDQYFKGEIAALALRRARNMASILFIKIFEARK